MNARDELRESIRELAIAAHPEVYVLEPWTLPGREPMPTFAVPRDHPASTRFNHLAQEVEPFTALYTAGPDGAFVSANTGQGWRVQPEHLPGAIVASAARELLFIGGDPDSAEELADRSSRVLDQITALLAGEAVDVPVLIAFSGIGFEPGAEVELPWGVARNASEFEQRNRPFGGRSSSLVVETPVSATLRIGEPETDGNFDPTALQRATRAASLLPLAVLVGVERDGYVVVEWLWQTVLFPASVGSSYTGSVSATSWIEQFMQPTVLTAHEQKQLTEWSTRIDEHHDPSIDVAIRRGLSAVRERANAEDALIDAVIAMENLFGHGGETEVTFRVSSAIAILLEDDAAARAGFRSRVSKIYRSRSTLVHGGTLDASELHDHKEQALGVMVQCLRTLFEREPHLIHHRDRGVRLILQTAGPEA